MAEPLSQLAKLVVAGAKARFGEDRWQKPMADLAGVTPSLLQKLVADADQRDVSVKTANLVANALIVEADTLEAQTEKVRTAAMKILKKLEGQ